MFIHGTKKLLNQLKVQPQSPQETADTHGLFSWHANVVKFDRRQSVVLMHDSSQYIIVLYGLRAKDFSRLQDVIKQAIQTVWREEGIKEDVIAEYLEQAGEMQFSRTANRSLVAKLNGACMNAGAFFEDKLNPDQLTQTAWSMHSSRMIVGGASGDYFQPNKALYEDLNQLTGEEILSVRAVELTVQLMLDSEVVWRQLLVPLNRTFEELHKILQVTFGWKDYHLHEYLIFTDSESNDTLSLYHPAYTQKAVKATVHLVENEEALEFSGEIPGKMETGIKLSQYLPAANLLLYVYDLGDDWRHQIKVTREIDHYPSNYPVCVVGEGNAPPEDVGGPPGYQAFLKIMDNPDHADYKAMKQWASNQMQQSFDQDRINRRLKDL